MEIRYNVVMTRIFLQEIAQSGSRSAIYDALLKALPAYVVVPGIAEADILLTADGAAVAGRHVPHWALYWSDGQPFAYQKYLRDAVCRSFSVQELHLVMHDGQQHMTLRAAAFSVVPGGYQATLSHACQCAAGLVIQALRDHENGVLTGQSFIALPMKQDAAASPPLAGYIWRTRLMLRWGVNFLERVLFHENWMIGWVDAPISESLRWHTCPPVRWIGARSEKRYLADPFAWPRQDHVVMCEEYDFATRLGRIKKLRVNGGDIMDEADIDFGLTGHLSYPFIFEHDGVIYCLPESCVARRLTIYRWSEPGGWSVHATPLTDIAAADSILFTHGGYFWIAYTDPEIDRFDNLNLCYAASLAGPWQLHANNPVRSDPRNARCGGTPFRHDGKLYRPAQDCAARYGAALRIMEIVTCTPTQYVEREVTTIQPERGCNPDGFHTLSACGDKCLVDGKKLIFSPRHIMTKILRRLRLAS